MLTIFGVIHYSSANEFVGKRRDRHSKVHCESNEALIKRHQKTENMTLIGGLSADFIHLSFIWEEVDALWLESSSLAAESILSLKYQSGNAKWLNSSHF